MTTDRTPPAQLSKIVAAGLSTSAVLGLVTVMGWASAADSAASSSAPQQAVAAPAPAAPAAPVVAAPVALAASSGAAPVSAAAVGGAATQAAPVTPTAAPQPVVIQLDVPPPVTAAPAPSGGSAPVVTSAPSA